MSSPFSRRDLPTRSWTGWTRIDVLIPSVSLLQVLEAKIEAEAAVGSLPR